MNKTVLIARSEFLRRVRSKWFIATTLLAPLFSLGLIVVPLLALGGSDDETERVAVRDETGRLAGPIAQALAPGVDLERAGAPLDTLRAQVLGGQLDGVLLLPASLLDSTAMGSDGPPAGAVYYSKGSGISGNVEIRNAVRDAVRRARAEQAGANAGVLDQFESAVGFDRVTVSEDGDSDDDVRLERFLLANVLSLLVYLAILIYGAMVMRGVIEEKANRIVEVIASSVRPFELMMGKVLGIGAVGLTQLVGWSLLMLLFSTLAGPIFLALAPDAPAGGPAGATPDIPFASAASILSPGLLVAFVLFFVGGYLLFSGLFAAVGSAVDQEADAQTLQAPIMVPLVLPVLFLTAVADNPDGLLALFLSLFPLSSPVIMIVRMAVSDVPWWQVVLALSLLVLAFVGVIALAARVYRVGILMYGKKATFSDLWRWMRTA